MKPQKIIVVMEHGKVIGIQTAPETTHGASTKPPSVSATLTIGPGQSQHELLVHMPERFKTVHEIETFHDSLAQLLSEPRART